MCACMYTHGVHKTMRECVWQRCRSSPSVTTCTTQPHIQTLLYAWGACDMANVQPFPLGLPR